MAGVSNAASPPHDLARHHLGRAAYGAHGAVGTAAGHLPSSVLPAAGTCGDLDIDGARGSTAATRVAGAPAIPAAAEGEEAAVGGGVELGKGDEQPPRKPGGPARRRAPGDPVYRGRELQSIHGRDDSPGPAQRRGGQHLAARTADDFADEPMGSCTIRGQRVVPGGAHAGCEVAGGTGGKRFSAGEPGYAATAAERLAAIRRRVAARAASADASRGDGGCSGDTFSHGTQPESGANLDDGGGTSSSGSATWAR